MEIDLITQIKSAYSSLTKSEQKVATYTIENMKHIAYVSVTDVAKKCGVGEATIFRFAKKIGYSGYYEFKKDIIEIIENKSENNKREAKNKTYDSIQTMLEHTIALHDDETLLNVAKVIKNANNIYIFGLGLSNLSAKAAEIRLSFMGYNTFAFSDNHIELIKANLIKENDVVIGLSVSGKTIDTIKHLEIAKSRGATIIGITNYRPSKISDLSDYTLLTASKDVLAQGTSLITQTSQLIVLEEICEKLEHLDKVYTQEIRKSIYNSY